VPAEPLSQAEYDQIYRKVPRLKVELVIVSAEGVLLMRLESGAGHELWHIPGGTVRYGELLAEAVCRVAREELAIDVTVDRFLGHVEYPSRLQAGRDWPVGVAFMLRMAPASARRFEPKPDALEWFDHLPDDMDAEQRRFLADHHLSVPVLSRHHSELSDHELSLLSEVLRRLGMGQSFTAAEALRAALSAGIINTMADIGSAIDDLEDAGVLRQVQISPPRWEAADDVS
jgi:ADP-ribose pyrophosphatase YjhB (NUDIX family)